jgi:hypothetical protein
LALSPKTPLAYARLNVEPRPSLALGEQGSGVFEVRPEL